MGHPAAKEQKQQQDSKQQSKPRLPANGSEHQGAIVTRATRRVKFKRNLSGHFYHGRRGRIGPIRDRIEYRIQPNGGVASARNTAFRLSRAPLIALLDGDDAYLPGYLRVQTEFFAEDPTLTLVYGENASVRRHTP